MRIAYIILCHTDPEHIRRLTKKITGGTDDEAFIHVDGKCDAAPFEQTLKDVPQAHFFVPEDPGLLGRIFRRRSDRSAAQSRPFMGRTAV
ncbi:MAG: hypothetical protein ACLUE8_09850 [Lachnospiraceae bacterium]